MKQKGRNTIIKELRERLVLSDFQYEVLVGIVLGDATLRVKGQLKCEQQFNKKNYIFHLYEIFRSFINQPPKLRKIVGGGSNERFSYWFQSFSHPDLKMFRDKFYISYINSDGKIAFRKSIVDRIFLEKWLTPRAIGYWFMDDGTAHRDKNGVIDYYNIATHGFNEEENKILSDIFKIKYDILVRVYRDRTHFYLNIPKNNIIKFRTLILPYIYVDFNYKFFD